jgi:hypothetical protein
MFDDGYRDRLQKWTQDKIDELGGLRTFAGKFTLAAAEIEDSRPISYETIRRWRDGILGEELKERSVRQIAFVRGESEDECRRWLEGGAVIDKDNPPIDKQQVDRLKTIEATTELIGWAVDRQRLLLRHQKPNPPTSLTELKMWIGEIVESGLLSATRIGAIVDGDAPTLGEVALIASYFGESVSAIMPVFGPLVEAKPTAPKPADVRRSKK